MMLTMTMMDVDEVEDVDALDVAVVVVVVVVLAVAVVPCCSIKSSSQEMPFSTDRGQYCSMIWHFSWNNNRKPSRLHYIDKPPEDGPTAQEFRCSVAAESCKKEIQRSFVVLSFRRVFRGRATSVTKSLFWWFQTYEVHGWRSFLPSYVFLIFHYCNFLCLHVSIRLIDPWNSWRQHVTWGWYIKCHVCPTNVLTPVAASNMLAARFSIMIWLRRNANKRNVLLSCYSTKVCWGTL